MSSGTDLAADLRAVPTSPRGILRCRVRDRHHPAAAAVVSCSCLSIPRLCSTTAAESASNSPISITARSDRLPRALPALRQALAVIDHHVRDYVARARLKPAHGNMTRGGVRNLPLCWHTQHRIINMRAFTHIPSTSASRA